MWRCQSPFFSTVNQVSLTNVCHAASVSPPNVCENQKKHPSLLSQSLASKRHRQPAKTNTVQGKERWSRGSGLIAPQRWIWLGDSVH